MSKSPSHWQQHHFGRLSPCQCQWLLAEGSLTRKLVAASGGQFELKILSQGLARVRPDEAKALKLGQRQLALVREIVMSGGAQPWVFARSVVPLSSLSGRLRQLKNLDNRPLGAMLFKDPSMQRSPIEIQRLAPAHINYPLDKPCWARRSIFHLAQKPLLVCEVFLPTFAPFHSGRYS